MYHLYGLLDKYEMSGLVVSHVNNADSSELITPNSLRGSRALAQIPTCVLGVQRTDDGSAKVYVVVVDRRLGIHGTVTMAYHNHRFTETSLKGEDLL